VISLAAVKTKKTNKPVKQVNNRTKKGTFKKGTSGNPNGRPKSGFALNEYITDLANVELEDKKTMLEAVVGKVYEEALDGNMSAINFLADRVLGKPSQSIGIKDVSDEPIKVFDIDGLDD
jgi:hypothetical protein